jgi:dihydroorotase
MDIPTISTEKSVKLIKDAKRKGLDISCSVSAHHLSLTDKELSSFDSRFKVSPPLRSAKDTRALKRGLNDGTIDMITSDHNPIDIENKKLELENSLYGTVGLESLFGSVNNVLDLEQTIDCLTDKPRKRFGLELAKIEKGEIANLTLFNPELNYTFTEDKILSKSKNSAFLGKKLKGLAYGIVVKNKLVLS